MSSIGNNLRLALTAGEPAGIGPDLLIQAAQHPFEVELVAITDPALLKARAAMLRLPLEIDHFDEQATKACHRPGRIKVLPVPLAEPAACGILNPANARAVLETLDRAAIGCLNGTFDAMVTAPVHKGIINDAGFPFTGHTEYLAERTGGIPVMLLSAPGLRVALVTTHVPLHQVSALITRDRLIQVLKILHHDLRLRFGIAKPKILVCGLNPHAGEGGHLGSEEIEHIGPAITALRAEGLDLAGPVPADTAFIPKYRQGFDAVLTMYHDQGLPVLKSLGFGEAVNITLGLPIIRTSVDHGTALDLAGTGRADCGSLLAAIRTAIEMAQHRARTP
jgi:4-hydroxythreonine-4-phosphate dehydrogenase